MLLNLWIGLILELNRKQEKFNTKSRENQNDLILFLKVNKQSNFILKYHFNFYDVEK